MLDTALLVRLVAVVHVLAAATVTLHALLHKHDVRAAAGRIGLAWLSPVVGCVLYWLLGVNRVARRASSLWRTSARIDPSSAQPSQVRSKAPPQVTFAALADLGNRITARPLEPGNTVPLQGGDEAYPAMLAAIRAAQRSIALATYLFRGDKTGRQFTDAIRCAKLRGVEVRVLIDGVGGGYFRSAPTRELRIRGVRVARFLHNCAPWRMPLLNMRNHRKQLIVDGAIAFTGGLNISDENLASSPRQRAVADVHFRVQGPVVTQLMAAFAQDWEFTTGEVLRGEMWFTSVSSAGNALARGIAAGPDADIDKLEMILLGALGEARNRARIVTPYFLPDRRLLSALAMAALRGVDVQIVIPKRSNKRVVDWAAAAQLGYVIKAGCRVALTPAPFDHAKLMTVDRAWCLVGSANWDERSLRLNFEFDLEVHDNAVAEAIDCLIDARIARARWLSRDELEARTWAIKVRDAAARLFLPYL